MNDLTFEASYWGNCCNTYDEETKQFVYARYMGLDVSGYQIDAKGLSILDIGGGPTSMLLKTVNRGRCMVVDPLIDRFPAWVSNRYDEAGITPISMRGEDIDLRQWFNEFDEVWIYNCLQHVDSPEVILAHARRIAATLRIFEWINIPPHEGHPHMLTQAGLDAWVGGHGSVIDLSGEHGCSGTGYYGVFDRASR